MSDEHADDVRRRDASAAADPNPADPDAADPAVVLPDLRDPEAAAFRDAMAATCADLAALADPPVPPAVAARWSAALAAESASRGEPVRPDRRGRSADRWVGNRAPRTSAGRRLLTAAAVAAVAAAGLGVLGTRSAPPSVGPVELVALGRSAVGTMDVGDLADPDRRAACLAAVAPAAVGERLLGGRRVVLDGRPGVLLVLATGARGGLRIVTVDPACGPTGGTLLAQVVVG